MSYDDGMPAGGNSRFRGYPARMSERQQLALILQMTSQEIVPGGNRTENTNTSSTTPRSSTLQQRGSKGRWTSKNGESAVQASINRKEDFRVRQILVNGYDLNAKEANDITGASSPDESAAAPNSPCSPSETSATAPSSEQEQEQQIYQHSQYQQSQQRTAGSAPTTAPHVAEDSGAPCEMRRTPPQNKVDRSGTGQSGSSPRVTLRLNQVRGARDEKKGGVANSRQGGMNAQNQGQMENSSKTSSVSSGAATSGSVASGGTSSTTDTGDVYEFKSSKEPTPVRGASSSPNPEKDKDANKPSNNQGGQSSSNNGSTANNPTSSETTTTSTTSEDAATVSVSPSSKRSFESDNAEEQDEENRRKKRKDSEPVKENLKGAATGRQSTGRNAANTGEKCTKSGKQGSGAASNKSNQSAASTNSDRKSPNASSMASSPKPSNPSGSTSSAKTTTPAGGESDGEDDRSKGSDSSSAPKVPPLKIVIPQSTTSEQEQGNRNGKSTSNRSHQLPYVVASSNSNDSTDKDQSQSASGTTSPTESGSNSKNEDKKDFSGALHGEERSTHHQRVLRSSHRTGNGGNGSATSKESSGSAGNNGSYSNSSPLPVTATDRSNNSSPQQRHHSPVPETTGSESSKSTATEASSSSAASKANVATEKSDKNNETKCQKDNGTENTESTSTTSSSTTSSVGTTAPTVELHPRKRKMKPSKEAQQAATAASNETNETANAGPEVHPHDQPITNCYQLFLNIRKQIERRRKGLFPVQPKPPQGFKDYLMNRCTYVLAGNANKEPNVNPPVGLQGPMKELYIEQEKERYRLRMQHVVEKEKLVLSVEQEILRVHGRAARALANQSLPFSVCTILKDEEVYNVITPEQEEKDRNARSRYNGRLFLSWLQDVDDKWEKIKEAMLLRHHNEAESLHAVQRMDWEWKLKEVGLCEFKATPQIEDVHVPMVHVSDDFDLLPA